MSIKWKSEEESEDKGHGKFGSSRRAGVYNLKFEGFKASSLLQ